MKLTILGSGAGIITARRGPSGYLINIGKKNILVDSGSGTLKKIAECSFSLKDIEYVVYSHFHPDHIVDMISLLFALMIPGDHKPEVLTLIGPDGIKDFYRNLSRDFGDILEPAECRLIIRELSDSYLVFEDFKLLACKVKHSDNSNAYRFETGNGKTLVYSGDTDYCKNIVNLAKDTDALLLECSFPKHIKVEGHLNSSFAGRIARESHCRKLILTHFYPICDGYDISGECKMEFSGDIILAEDFMSIEI